MAPNTTVSTRLLGKRACIHGWDRLVNLSFVFVLLSIQGTIFFYLIAISNSKAYFLSIGTLILPRSG